MELQGFSGDQIDRFSALPPEVAHRILSPLSFTDAARVGSLSKRCRSFHLSNPTLNLTTFPAESTRTFHNRLELINSLDQLFLHRGNNKIQSFSVNWVSNYRAAGEWVFAGRFCDEKSRVIDWIRHAVSCKVESLTVVCKAMKDRNASDWEINDETIELPCCVFVCESLRSLTVDTKCVAFKKDWLFPTLGVSSNLVCLRLTDVKVEDDDGFCKWVSFSCKFLKELLLKMVSGLKNITIESSSLESFQIDYPSGGAIVVRRRNPSRGRRVLARRPESLKLSAPNLKHLKWVGDFMMNLNIGELNCLDEVEISLGPPIGVRTEHDLVSLSGFISARDRFLHSIRNAKVLILDERTTKTLFRKGFKLSTFNNVLFLRMHVRHMAINDELVPVIASLFKGMPNLNTLEILSGSAGTGTSSFGFSRKYWEEQGLDFISQLKEVTLELTNGSNGIALAWYILEHAQNLKKIIITYCPQLPHHIGFMAKLKKTTINSSAIVLFKEDLNSYNSRV